MRHGKKINHLGRKYGHRKAMLSNMANSLIEHKRIITTTAKAKELRKFIEPLITKAKTDSTHNRRVVFSYLQSKDAVKSLFTDVGVKVGDRPGGYTRILKTHNRLGDNAEMCMMELVDYNELMLEAKGSKSAAKPGKKRSRRGGGKGKAEAKPAEVKAEATNDVAEKTAAPAEDTTEEKTEE